MNTIVIIIIVIIIVIIIKLKFHNKILSLFRDTHTDTQLLLYKNHHHHLPWHQANENGSRVHLAEPRHATTAITEEAIAVMESHKVFIKMVITIMYGMRRW